MNRLEMRALAEEGIIEFEAALLQTLNERVSISPLAIFILSNMNVFWLTYWCYWHCLALVLKRWLIGKQWGLRQNPSKGWHHSVADLVYCLPNGSIGDLVTHSVGHSWYVYFWNAKSGPRVMYPSRPLIRFFFTILPFFANLKFLKIFYIFLFDNFTNYNVYNFWNWQFPTTSKYLTTLTVVTIGHDCCQCCLWTCWLLTFQFMTIQLRVDTGQHSQFLQ